MKYGYVPFAVFDTESTGRQTKEASRTLEYAFNDFGVALAAKELGDDKLHADMLKRSMNESSAAEYAFWAPHDGAGIVNLTSHPKVVSTCLD
ncbi:unnamed protein product [Tilletia controversa]|uniref:Glycosyl hydrolase family 92 domain-containing protein n=2 Tax=Tilletia TaxID=13289 RepID=A0ABN7J7E1_9BASI|nr:hypothetical protein CF335_g8421 [Tilletia laevis]KAE8184130.1 hypothetical protein CF328_g7959 [Tilletia controversa]CAD6953513.1 unnamed protein product [Tilletia caries]CAD6980594.1 unnamed protein product [Tilletia controversa]CAD7065672.1 unnamed protein product [Tilletia caries]